MLFFKFSHLGTPFLASSYLSVGWGQRQFNESKRLPSSWFLSCHYWILDFREIIPKIDKWDRYIGNLHAWVIRQRPCAVPTKGFIAWLPWGRKGREKMSEICNKRIRTEVTHYEQVHSSVITSAGTLVASNYETWYQVLFEYTKTYLLRWRRNALDTRMETDTNETLYS